MNFTNYKYNRTYKTIDIDCKWYYRTSYCTTTQFPSVSARDRMINSYRAEPEYLKICQFSWMLKRESTVRNINWK